MYRFPAACLLALTAQAAVAIEPLPKASGWHGYLSPVVSAMEFRDNSVAGSGPLDVGNERIDSLDEKAKKQSVAAFSLPAEVGYMFADQGVYLFLGNRLEDFLRLDNGNALGTRVDLDRLGILEASALFSAMPTEVWEDPFLTGADRQETDRTSAGAQLGLANILGTKFEANVTFRSIEIDDEHSGESLGLSEADRDLLVRNGDSARLELLYTWKINDRNILVPALEVGTYDAEGDAYSRDGAGVQLTHVYVHDRLRLVSNLLLRQTSFDEKNPVFGEKQDEDEVVLSLTGFYARFFGQPNLSGMASLLYTRRDSQITFYDAEASVASLGLLYTF